MSGATRLTRPAQTWALAYENSFANPATPTAAELNELRFVHRLSCAFTEDGTNLTLGDSVTDDTIVFCDIAPGKTPIFKNLTSSLTWLLDANTGGSGSTADLTSLYNKATSLLGSQDVNYWVISRTGPQYSQDSDFAVGQVIKMGLFGTDLPQFTIESNKPLRGVQNLIFRGSVNYNYLIAS